VYSKFKKLNFVIHLLILQFASLLELLVKLGTVKKQHHSDCAPHFSLPSATSK